jgi:SAM-dependent methyltransferase
MSRVFDAYAAYYDLLYQDKDYAGEAKYVADLLRELVPGARSLLELGCGTGIHAAHLARLGYEVRGVDISHEMLARADELKGTLEPELAARLHFEQGDLRSWRRDEKYDAVLSLFHVLSYQIADEDVRAAVATAAAHLKPRGVLIADFWYGPAVEKIIPETRTKHLRNDQVSITRIAIPMYRPEVHQVDVHYDITVLDLQSGAKHQLNETHRMRYFFEAELEDYVRERRLLPVYFREWMTHNPPCPDSWSVTLAARMAA